MAVQRIIRKILVSSKEFKTFWQENGPYCYAVTSNEFPPVLMKDEEWIFSNDVVLLLKELMQYTQQKMKIIKAPFNCENKSILRPDELSQWKIVNFPELWNGVVSEIFVPEGHLTHKVIDTLEQASQKLDATRVESAFFQCLEQEMEQMGYLLFKPRNGAKRAAVQSYLKEWEADESDAGLM